MRTVYLGTSEFAVDVLDAVAATPHRPVLVVTRPDRVEYVFAASGSGTVLFAVQPDDVGSGSGTVTVAGGAPVRVNQFVFP